MAARAAILDFAIGQKFFGRLVLRVDQYVPGKFCPNQMNGIHLPSQNLISEPKFCRNSNFDRGGHLELCEKRKILSQTCF